jgi:hypothetical protein
MFTNENFREQPSMPVAAATAKLNPRHEKFIAGMVRHGDKIRAYKEAYPNVSDESAKTLAPRLLKNPEIKERLQRSWKKIHLGVEEDVQGYLHQERKILETHRQVLNEIIMGIRPASPTNILKAIKMDRELAEQHAQLLGYGSLKALFAAQSDIKVEEQDLKNESRIGGEVNKNEHSIPSGPAKHPLYIPLANIAPIQCSEETAENPAIMNFSEQLHQSIPVPPSAEQRRVAPRSPFQGDLEGLIEDNYFPSGVNFSEQHLPSAPSTSIENEGYLRTLREPTKNMNFSEQSNPAPMHIFS